MALDPSNPILPNNRGLAHLKKGDFRAAETDCSAGLALDPNNVKALWRRGIARSELGKLVESEADLELALKLDPTNKEVKKELVRVEGMIVSQRAMEKPGFESRRMKITEVDSLQSMPPTSEEPRRMKIEEVDEIATSRRMKIEEVDEIATPRRMKIEEVDEIVVSRRLKIEEVEDNEVGSVNGTVEELPSKSKSAEEPSRANGTTVGPAGQTDVPIHKPSTSAQPSAGPARQLPPPPSSMLDFERDLRGLRKDPEGLYHYFKAIEPRSLLSIMKGGLESQHLSQICTVLQKFYIE